MIDATSEWITSPEQFGLAEVNTKNAAVVSGAAELGSDGAKLTLVRSFDGFGADVELVETITALYGTPAFRYELHFTNNGTSDRWLAWADNLIAGAFGQTQSWLKTPYWGKSLYNLSEENFAEHIKYWYNPPAWCYLASWDDSGRGVGLTTLQMLSGDHYHNKTYWKASSTSFSLEQVETVKGYPPILISPSETIEVGGCFIAADPGTDPFRQTGLFFYSLDSADTPDYETPFAARLDGEVVEAAKADNFLEHFDEAERWFVDGCDIETAGSGAEITLQGSTSEISCALETNFTEDKFFNIDVAQASASVGFNAYVKAIDGGSPINILSKSAGEAVGSFAANISQITGWSDYTSYELVIEFTGSAGDTVNLAEVSVLPTPPEAPEAVSPQAGWNITDISAAFSWKGVEGITDYQLQISRDSNFTDPIVVEFTSDNALCVYHTVDLLDTGGWYWRVCGVDGLQTGYFSQPVSFTVNDYKPKTDILREVNSDNPLFTLEAQKVPDLSKFADAVPQDIRQYTAIVSNNRYFVYENTNIEHYSKVAGQDNNFLLRTQGPDLMGWKGMSLTDVEYLFQTYPNIIGVCVGENFWNYWNWEADGTKEYITRLIKLCAKYGRLYIWGDGNGTTFKWQQFASNDYWINIMAEYGEYMTLSQKNNVNHTMHTTQGALMGIWLSDWVSNLGSWSECWYWNDAGFAELDEYLGPKMGYIEDFPRNFYNMSFMHGIAQGAAVFNVDGQGTTGSIKASIWNTDGQTTETFTDYVVPFIRGVVNHNLVPKKEDVLENVKVAIAQPERFENIPHEGDYGIYQALYDQTYGFRTDGKWYEYFPNTGKYYYFPLLPYGVNTLPNSARIETLSDMDDPAYVSSVFDAEYSEPYLGDALYSTVGDSVFIQSTRENSSDIETYDIAADNANISRITGDIGAHKYIMGKFEAGGSRLWMQANTEYWQNSTEIEFECLWKPLVSADPAGAVMSESWSPETGAYNIYLTHLYGAAELTLDNADINGDEAVNYADIFTLAAGWLTTGSELIGDFNNDGIITFADYAILARRISRDD